MFFSKNSQFSRSIVFLFSLAAIFAISACGKKTGSPPLDKRWVNKDRRGQRTITKTSGVDSAAYYAFGLIGLKNMMAAVDIVQSNGHSTRPDDTCTVIKPADTTTTPGSIIYTLEPANTTCANSHNMNMTIAAQTDGKAGIKSISRTDKNVISVVQNNPSNIIDKQVEIENEHFQITLNSGVGTFSYSSTIVVTEHYKQKGTKNVLHTKIGKADIKIDGQLNISNRLHPTILVDNDYQISFDWYYDNTTAPKFSTVLSLAAPEKSSVPLVCGVPVEQNGFSFGENVTPASSKKTSAYTPTVKSTATNVTAVGDTQNVSITDCNGLSYIDDIFYAGVNAEDKVTDTPIKITSQGPATTDISTFAVPAPTANVNPIDEAQQGPPSPDSDLQ